MSERRSPFYLNFSHIQVFYRDVDYNSGSCQHTVEGYTTDGQNWRIANDMDPGNNRMDSWWAVNLTDSYVITHVEITTRGAGFSAEGRKYSQDWYC